MGYVAEVVPESTMKDLIEDNWVDYLDTPKPDILIANDPDEAISRFDLNNGDVIVIRGDPEQIRPRGNFTYYDRIQGLNISFYTMKDRQRLKDMYKMIRAICFIKKHTFTGWQLIRPISYQEMVMESLNIWKAEIRLQLENNAITCETTI